MITDEISERFYPGVTCTTDNNPLSHILLIFKYYIYISKRKTNTKYQYSNSQFNKSKEKREANKRYYQYKRSIQKKWCITDNILPVP